MSLKEFTMEQDRLVRIEENNNHGLLRYRIFGLNIFAANTTQENPNLLALQDKPVLEFLGTLTKPYDVICLLGSPALDNWRNQQKREGRTDRIEDLLANTNYSMVRLSYYGGSFRAEQNYGPSILFRLHDQELLAKLSHPFLDWDAIALFMYAKGKDGLGAAQNALAEFTIEAALIDALLQEARCVILTQADCQYPEVYTKSSNLMEDLDAARVESEAYINNDADWYQIYKARLVWDERELCYVISK